MTLTNLFYPYDLCDTPPSPLAVDDMAYRAARVKECRRVARGVTLVSIAQRSALIITSPCAALTRDMFFFLPFKFLTRTIVCFVHGLFYVNLSFSQSICFSFLSAPSNFNVRIHVPSTVTGFSSLAYQTVSPPDFIFFHYCVERPLSYTAPFSISHESRITQVRL